MRVSVGKMAESGLDLLMQLSAGAPRELGSCASWGTSESLAEFESQFDGLALGVALQPRSRMGRGSHIVQIIEAAPLIASTLGPPSRASVSLPNKILSSHATMAGQDFKVIDTSGRDGLPAPEFFDRRSPDGTMLPRQQIPYHVVEIELIHTSQLPSAIMEWAVDRRAARQRVRQAPISESGSRTRMPNRASCWWRAKALIPAACGRSTGPRGSCSRPMVERAAPAAAERTASQEGLGNTAGTRQSTASARTAETEAGAESRCTTAYGINLEGIADLSPRHMQRRCGLRRR